MRNVAIELATDFCTNDNDEHRKNEFEFAGSERARGRIWQS